MSKDITINVGGTVIEAELGDGPTAQKVWDALPIEARGNTWGDEIYFSIPVQAGEEPGAVPEVDEGDLAYWPPGPAFCIFFGPTPASAGDEPRAASAVSRFGRITGDATLLRSTPSSVKVRVEKA